MAVDFYDTQAESSLISTLFFHPDFALHSGYLKASYFYNKENGCLYWAVNELLNKGIENIDTINISNILASNPAVAQLMRSKNIESLEEYFQLSQVMSRDTLEEYKALADTIVTLAYKRDTVATLAKLNEMFSSKQMSIMSMNNTLYGSFDKLTENYIVDGEIKTFGEVAKESYADICSRRNETGFTGLPSKFQRINNYFTYEKGELILIKARMKMGKSAFLMNEALHKIKCKVPTVYFDTDMNDRLFTIRVLANISGVDQKKVKDGNMSAKEQAEVDKALKLLEEAPFVHIYDPAWDKNKVITTCKILQRRMDLQFVVFDYIKSNTTSSSEQYNELGEMCDFLHNKIAGELDLAVLAAAQLNRQNMVADSDKIERYVSVSCEWRKKTPEEIETDGSASGNCRLSVDLNRLGECMSEGEYADFQFNGNSMQIYEAKAHTGDSEFDF